MTLDQALADARATFPNFPDEAFTLWLDDRIRQNGWPPSGIEWAGFLDGKPIDYWQSLMWQRSTVTLTPEDLSSNGINLVTQLIEAASGVKNIMARYIPNTAERFISCLTYIRANATTPGVVLLHRSEDGMSIIDGNHRIAALMAFQGQFSGEIPPLPIEAWVATPPS